MSGLKGLGGGRREQRQRLESTWVILKHPPFDKEGRRTQPCVPFDADLMKEHFAAIRAERAKV